MLPLVPQLFRGIRGAPISTRFPASTRHQVRPNLFDARNDLHRPVPFDTPILAQLYHPNVLSADRRIWYPIWIGTTPESLAEAALVRAEETPSAHGSPKIAPGGLRGLMIAAHGKGSG